MKIILFLLDAYKGEYLSKSNTPFLYNLSKKGKYIENIIPSAGFCERTEIFFGLKPNESGFFTAIGFDPENSPYKDDKILNFLGDIETIISIIASSLWPKKQNSIEYFFRKILLNFFNLFNNSNQKLGVYNIPLRFLKYFNLIEDEIDLEKIDEIANKKSLFKIISQLDGETYMGAFTALGSKSNGDDLNRVNLAIEASKKKNNFFIPVYLSVADSFGHNYGPNSNELIYEINKLDNILKDCVERLLKIDNNTKFIFLGDHGMSNVTSTINVKKEILKISKKHNLNDKKDFIYFLDSTLFRIWFFNKKAMEIFKKEINNNSIFSKKGIIINKSIAKKYNISFNDRKNGDLIWWANEGVLIYPDFFHQNKAMLGMHGYKPDSQSTYGTCVIWHNTIRKEKVKEMHLSKVYDEICNLIN